MKNYQWLLRYLKFHELLPSCNLRLSFHEKKIPITTRILIAKSQLPRLDCILPDGYEGDVQTTSQVKSMYRPHLHPTRFLALLVNPKKSLTPKTQKRKTDCGCELITQLTRIHLSRKSKFRLRRGHRQRSYRSQMKFLRASMCWV